MESDIQANGIWKQAGEASSQLTKKAWCQVSLKTQRRELYKRDNPLIACNECDTHQSWCTRFYKNGQTLMVISTQILNNNAETFISYSECFRTDPQIYKEASDENLTKDQKGLTYSEEYFTHSCGKCILLSNSRNFL